MDFVDAIRSMVLWMKSEFFGTRGGCISVWVVEAKCTGVGDGGGGGGTGGTGGVGVVLLPTKVVLVL